MASARHGWHVVNHIFRPGDLALVNFPRSVKTPSFSHARSGERTGRHVSVDPCTTAEGSRALTMGPANSHGTE